MKFRRILIAVDDSPICARAAFAGVELAHALGGETAFVHAIDPSREIVPMDSGTRAEQFIAMAREDAKRLFGQLRSQTPGVPAHEFLVEGNPAEEIVRAAAEWPADVIVIGSHGRRGVTRALLGSVAEGVMRQSPCPVLVVPAIHS